MLIGQGSELSSELGMPGSMVGVICTYSNEKVLSSFLCLLSQES